MELFDINPKYNSELLAARIQHPRAGNSLSDLLQAELTEHRDLRGVEVGEFRFRGVSSVTLPA